jgi:hypothetical protein
LNGRLVEQVAIGVYQIVFGFDEDVRISVEGRFDSLAVGSGVFRRVRKNNSRDYSCQQRSYGQVPECKNQKAKGDATKLSEGASSHGIVELRYKNQAQQN